jgi:DNA invertase Pin-like site-specific DNA recombinase
MLAIYCRISGKKNDGVDTSIKTQLQLGKELAHKLGLKFDTFVDEGISGTNSEVEVRPEFARMLKAIQKKEISAVYTQYQDRLERNPIIWHLFVATMIEFNCKFYPQGVFFDLENPQNRFIASVQSASNALYASLTSQRVKKSIKIRAEEGRFRGQLPYGFKYDDKNHILVNEDEAKYVRMMYKWSLEGEGSYTIANKLNKLEVPTKFNKYEGEIKRIDPYTKEKTFFDKKAVKWRGNVVHDIITNPINKGFKYINDDLYMVPHIIEEHIWNKTIEHLQINKKNVGKKTSYNYLLNGLMYCSHCGRQMVGKKRISSGDNSYKCKGKIYPNNLCNDSRAINIYKLESFIIKHLFKSKELYKHLEQLPEKQNEFSSKKEELDKQSKILTKLQKDIKLGYVRLLDSDFEHDDTVKESVNQLKKKIAKQEQILKNLEKEVILLEGTNSKERVKQLIKDYVETLEFNDVKRLIHSLIDSIKIGQVKEEGKMGTFIINIKYKGFDEISTFITNWFSIKWMWISKYRNQAYTQEQIEEDREKVKALFEFNNIVIDDNYIKELKKTGMTDEEIDRQNPWSLTFIGLESMSTEYSVIDINEEDIINFN